MDEWLYKYSGQNRRGNTAATWVIADRDYRVVSYATLSMTAIDRSACPTPLAKSAPAQIPALLVGRLATDESAGGLGLGTQMVLFVLATALDLNNTAAFRAVVVNALNVDAYEWWQRFGFVPLDPENDASMDLYLLTADIAATLKEMNPPFVKPAE
ncbi:N-acetyltransferase [Rhodococcus erythropolis]|uniref:GNAT family N-acetyltransferase n=1 Tax=Rhodococcus erythropolis TaxID=1833 RepID=UPI0029490E82|nr:GNAT family N-acetyltransferase [Rhodococcus erythropolis]MDV6278440.1 N-acetyltransferase [Rhodococcus erythropolis]